MIILATIMSSCMSFKVSDKPIDNPLSRSVQYNEEGLKYANEGKYDKALDWFNKAINENPNNPMALNNRGLIYQDRGLFKEALADYEKAVQITPDYYIPYANMSMVYVLLEDYKKAIEYADKSIALDSKSNYTAYVNRSIAYGMLKQHDKAIADCNKAIDINPQEVGPCMNRGLSLIETGKLEQGKRDILCFQKSYPDVYQSYYGLAKYYEKKGNKKMAIENYKKAIKIIEKEIISSNYLKSTLGVMKKQLRNLER
jgi:tetratricopeptide (TPR) repeat protein